MYTDKLKIVNIGLSAMKEFQLSSKFALGVSGKLIANPYEKKMYFVAGIQVPFLK